MADHAGQLGPAWARHEMEAQVAEIHPDFMWNHDGDAAPGSIFGHWRRRGKAELVRQLARHCP